MKSVCVSIGTLFLLAGCVPTAQQGGRASTTYGTSPSCSSGVECQNIGLQHAGRGDQKHYAIASRYFKKSCDYGLSEGCNNLAFLYANARGVKQSYTQAYRYWGMACRMGNESACANLELAKDKVAAMHKR